MRFFFQFFFIAAVLLTSGGLTNAQIVEDDATLVESSDGFFLLEARLQHAKQHGGLVAFSLEDLGDGDFQVGYQGIAQLIAGYNVSAGESFDSEYALNNIPLAINNNSINNTVVHLEVGESFFFCYWDDTVKSPSANLRIDPDDGFGWAEIRRNVVGLELLGSATANSCGIVTGSPLLTPKPLLGDVNEDGQINLLDVGPFVDLLAIGSYQAEADMDQNGLINLLDVQPFVDVLAGKP